jgi:ferredoxin
MKIVILTFSLTGNTKLAAKRVAAKLTETGKNTVEHVNLVKLSREFDSIGLQGPLLASVRKSIQASDVVAIGCFSNFLHPAHRVSELFAEAVLPAILFANMKYFFVFGTAGQNMGRTLGVTATILFEKNESAKFLGELSILAPENVVHLLPQRPFRDTWRPSELTHADEFGAQVARFLDGSEPLPNLPVSKKYPFTIVTKMGWVKRKMTPVQICDRSRCSQCGTCVRKCPYNAIEINPDIEDGFPVFNFAKCEACSRCLNKCPMEAIQVPSCRTETRSRYVKANVVPVGEKCADGMISQSFPLGIQLNKRAMTGQCGFAMLVMVLVPPVIIGVILASA